MAADRYIAAAGQGLVRQEPVGHRDAVIVAMAQKNAVLSHAHLPFPGKTRKKVVIACHRIEGAVHHRLQFFLRTLQITQMPNHIHRLYLIINGLEIPIVTMRVTDDQYSHPILHLEIAL